MFKETIITEITKNLNSIDYDIPVFTQGELIKIKPLGGNVGMSESGGNGPHLIQDNDNYLIKILDEKTDNPRLGLTYKHRLKKLNSLTDDCVILNPIYIGEIKQNTDGKKKLFSIMKKGIPFTYEMFNEHLSKFIELFRKTIELNNTKISHNDIKIDNIVLFGDELKLIDAEDSLVYPGCDSNEPIDENDMDSEFGDGGCNTLASSGYTISRNCSKLELDIKQLIIVMLGNLIYSIINNKETHDKVLKETVLLICENKNLFTNKYDYNIIKDIFTDLTFNDETFKTFYDISSLIFKDNKTILIFLSQMQTGGFRKLKVKKTKINKFKKTKSRINKFKKTKSRKHKKNNKSRIYKY